MKKQHCNLKPLLTDDHKLLRVAWIRNLIKDDGMYCNMMQYNHIDKKWFTLVTDGDGYYLSTAEKQIYSNVQHKKHITKIMFLSAIACPCITPSTGEMFNGKIGIWEIDEELPAACNSKNQPAGIMKWHQMSANKQKIREMLIDNVLPAIDRKRPVGWRRKTVLCQQDSTSPHLLSNNAEFLLSCKGKHLLICLAKNLGELIDAIHLA